MLAIADAREDPAGLSASGNLEALALTWGERMAGGTRGRDRLVGDLSLDHEVVGTVVAAEAAQRRLVAQVVRVGPRLNLHGRGRNECVLGLQLVDRRGDLPALGTLSLI